MTNVPIKWSDIEAEAQEFRQGLVTLFRKYEGQPTDEKDGSGRVIKVTASSFARHFGIDRQTFARWIRVVDNRDRRPSETPERLDQRRARNLVRTRPELVVEAVSELPEETQHEIVRELHKKQLERAGADFSRAGRKSREATTHEHFEPLRRSLNAIKVIATLEKAAEELRNLPADLTEEDRREIDSAVDDVVLARTEMHMSIEVND